MRYTYAVNSFLIRRLHKRTLVFLTSLRCFGHVENKYATILGIMQHYSSSMLFEDFSTPTVIQNKKSTTNVHGGAHTIQNLHEGSHGGCRCESLVCVGGVMGCDRVILGPSWHHCWVTLEYTVYFPLGLP